MLWTFRKMQLHTYTVFDAASDHPWTVSKQFLDGPPWNSWTLDWNPCGRHSQDILIDVSSVLSTVWL